MDRISSKFGWVISGTLIGAAIGFWLAQASPVYDNHTGALQEARLKTADRLLPFVFIASVAGAVLGWLCERRLAKRILLKNALVLLAVLAIGLVITIELIQLAWQLVRGLP